MTSRAGHHAVLSSATLAAYAAPAAPISALGLPIAVYLPPFYAAEMGLGLSVVGTIFMLTRFWDVLIDPALGVLSDRFPTRWGRRRQWIVLGSPIVMVCSWMVFMPVPPVSATYLLGWLLVLYVGWTLLTISHMSWGAELTVEYHERSVVQGWREVFLIAGMVTVLALPALIERGGAADAAVQRVTAMGWFVIVLLPFTVLLALWRVPELPAASHPHLGLRRALELAIENRPLRRVLLMDLLSGYGAGIVASLFLFVAVSALDLGKYASLLLLCYFISGCLCIAPMLRLSYRWSKHRTLAVSSLFNGLALPFIFLLPPGNVPVAVAMFVVFGANMGIGPLLFRSIMADVADEDHVRSGVSRTGLFFSLLIMTNKAGHALAIGSVYVLLDWIGFAPGAANDAEAIAGLMNLFVFPTMVASILVTAIMWNFPLGAERQRELRAILEERRARVA
ncbi:MFS transporter [Candidatus Binatia bacterium]|nr:MFS transporter [Candidatus Binatia bacterium]